MNLHLKKKVSAYIVTIFDFGMTAQEFLIIKKLVTLNVD